MAYKDLSAEQFDMILSSKEPIPGGGGAAAITGAMGASLGAMVCNLTIGKKKYTEYEAENIKILSAFEKNRDEFLSLADADARAFLPLSEAYKLPKDAENRDMILEEALCPAAEVPLRVMRLCGETVELFGKLKNQCSVLAISDVGVGVKLIVSALESAALNVYINTKLMKNDFRARLLECEAEELCEVYTKEADEIYGFVLKAVKPERE